MKLKRILSALLAALLLISTFASCASGDGGNDTDQQSGNQETEAETGIFSEGLPEELDFNGDEITIISRYKEGWTSGEIAVEGLKGEPVNDIIHERNKAVEEYLNIKIVSIEDHTEGGSVVVNKVATAVQGGSKDYDIMAASCCDTVSQSLSGTFMNLRGPLCEYLDLDQPWWTQGFNEAVEYQGAQYAILGSMVLSMYRFGFVTVFNKNIFNNASQPLLYDYVKDGTWTLDKQAELAPIFHKDNGNGIQDRTGDVYGFVSNTWTNIDAYWSACQLTIIQKDEDGFLQMVSDMDRLHGTADKLINLFFNTNGATYDVPYVTDDEIWGAIRQIFADGYGAMASFRFMEMENAVMRNMENEYGVVPMPKYDTNQDGYYTLLHDQFTVAAIPATVVGDRLTEASTVLEAMSSASYTLVKPVYYEETLRTKIAQDPTAAEMMDIITDNVYIDAGILYIGSLGAYHHSLRSVVESRTNNAVSMFTAKNRACVKAIEQLSKKLDKQIAREK